MRRLRRPTWLWTPKSDRFSRYNPPVQRHILFGARAIRILLGLAFLLLLLDTRGDAAPQSAKHHATLSAYLAIVQQHEPGKADPFCQVLSGWDELEIERAARSLLSLAATLHDARSTGRPLPEKLVTSFGVDLIERVRRDPVGIVKRAVLLHADRAVQNCETPDHQRESLLYSAVVRPQLEWLEREAGEGRFSLAWHSAVGARLSGTALWSAGYVLARGLELFPDSAELLLAAGAVDESFARADVQRDVRESGIRNRRGVLAEFSIGNSGAQLERAARHLRKALALDPSLAEARLRLGHVLLEDNQVEEARRQLEQTLLEAQEPFVVYHALLFLGRLQQGLGHTAAAREYFETAVARFPRIQTPRVALSGLLAGLGDRTSALETLQPAMSAGEASNQEVSAEEQAAGNAGDRDDHWIRYQFGSSRRASALFTRLWSNSDGATGGPR
jgi:tetratricopeptide (TPR) repeat protein